MSPLGRHSSLAAVTFLEDVSCHDLDQSVAHECRGRALETVDHVNG